jgi:hypothetical protein
MKKNGNFAMNFIAFNNGLNQFSSEVFLPEFRNLRIAFCALL